MRGWDREEDESRRARRWLPVLGLTVVVFQVALVVTTFVSAPHNGGDNAGYITLATSLLDGGYADLWDSTAPPHTKYPPVFPALLAGLIALGATTWTVLKAVPATFTVLAVLLAYAWAAGRRGPFFGAVVAALTGLSSAVIWSSRWILSDPTFVALTLLALWALDRAEGIGGSDGKGRGPAEDAGSAGSADPAGPGSPRSLPVDPGWLALGVAAAVLAYFTRSAGLPLLVALGLWLGLRRRWAALGVVGLVAGVPAVAWWLRARTAGDVDYVSEFWMVDPYSPELGRVGVGGLVERVVDNLQGYVGTWIPEGLVGAEGAWVGLLGLALAALAVTGWARRMGRRPAAAELFFPLYAGLILLWPQVWSGDRFALPLFPLLLLYAGEGLQSAAELWGRKAAGVALAVGVAALAVPASMSWLDMARGATECGALTRAGGTWACHGSRWTEFAEAARWSGANLGPDAAVLSRKPRLFYVEGGVPGRTFPFTADPDAFLAEAEAAGARYVVMDYVDGQATRYLGFVIRARPSAFCAVRSFPAGDPQPTRLLGLVPPDSELGGQIVESEGRSAAALPPCPPDLRPGTEVAPPPLRPAEVPLLVGRRE